MTERAVGTLRREIEQHEPTRGKRYEKQLQDRVIAYAQERRSASASWKTIATELGRPVAVDEVRGPALDALAEVFVLDPIDSATTAGVR